MTLYVLLIIVGLILIIYFVIIYNGFVSMRRNIDKALSNIDVLLKQRFDELPKLVAVCEGYIKHERETLEAVAKARAGVAEAKTVGEKFVAEGEVSRAVHSLFAVAEKYPDLKADKLFLGLQARITELEDQIADRREYMNEVVTLFNTRIEQIPDVVVASTCGFNQRELWKINPEDRADPKIAFKQ